MSPIELLQREITSCTLCKRLVDHCRSVAVTKRRAYRDQEYWGRPVPSFGDPNARLLILGLAPGAHGANRTGRMFTGDSSGDWLYKVLHAAGFASQSTSRSSDDGLQLHDAYITASCHCAPPDNKPATEEVARCRTYLEHELDILPNVQVVVALGKLAHDNYLTVLKDRRAIATRAAYPFAHNATHATLAPVLIDSYHPSQQNTSTGKLTESMLLDVFRNVRSRFR
ncbi:MAG TPA: uracil-DNA glycosylase [Bryobacteraceae bacterium]|nr:uracil-DNA glycosylase [Bryobacteraceae bacterium]